MCDNAKTCFCHDAAHIALVVNVKAKHKFHV